MDGYRVAEGSNGTGLAGTAVDTLTKPLMDTLPETPDPGAELIDEARESIFTKIKFEWDASDQVILQRIKAAVDREFGNNFAPVVLAVDRLFASLRVPATEVIDGVEKMVTDHRGRQMWEADERTGRPREDISQLTGQDIAEALLNLSRIRMDVSARVAELLTDAIYAKMSAGDISDDRWWKTMDGTIPDRKAAANRESRQDRYHAHFRFCLWLTSKEFLDEVGRFMDRLEKIGTWKSFEK